MSLRPHYSFLQQLPWQIQSQNALQYNTSTPGLVIQIVYGTLRVASNLLAFGGYSGPGGGKKGKGVGPLPIGGTNTVAGKGLGSGASKKGVGGKKGPQDFSVDVDFGLCQGPVNQLTFTQGLVFVNGMVAGFDQVGLNFYAGVDGQAPDGTMAGLGDIVGYSGSCHYTGTPLDLGTSPVLPNLQVEVYGILSGTFPGTPDANAALVVADLLTNPRYGIQFPAQYLDPNIDATYGAYCLAAGLPISVTLDAQQKGTEWLDGLAKMTNTAVVCSGPLVLLIPYGDLPLTGSGVTWTPPNNLTPVAALDDDDFLPWHPRSDADDEPQAGEDDPVIPTRVNPADRANWLTIQYKDRNNFYNDNTLSVFDQGHIDLYGRRDGETLPGKCFCSPQAAQISAQLFLQRGLYVDTVRFKAGWQHALIEPMDVVLLTDPGLGFAQLPFRITSRERNANGDLTFEAETISPGAAAPQTNLGNGAVLFGGGSWMRGSTALWGPDTPTGTFSVWINPAAITFAGLIGSFNIATSHIGLGVTINADGSVGLGFEGAAGQNPVFTSPPNTVVAGAWQNLAGSWDMSAGDADLYVNGSEVDLTLTGAAGGFAVAYSLDGTSQFYSAGITIPEFDTFDGCTADLWLLIGTRLNLASAISSFIQDGTAAYLGAQGQLPAGQVPQVFLHNNGTAVPALYPNLGTAGPVGAQGDVLTLCATSPF